MRNINELIGIIKGINFDGVINDMEVARLQMWVDKNRNLSFGKTQMTMIKMLDKALEDHIITDDERKQLLIYSEGILNNQEDDLSSDYELNGIIEGIICDNELNLAEVIRLKQWLEKNSKTLYSNLDNKIIDLIENIISGEVNIEEVQNEFLQLLRNRNNDNSLQIKIEYLKRLVRERKNIGLDLIDILDNRTAIEYIHREAEEQLRRLMLSYSGIILNDTEIIFISLCLIGMLEYDGTYYENVRNTYEKLYNIFSDQKIEGTIRTILSKYRTSEEKKKSKSRIINVALSNAIVPAHFLPAFFDFIYDIYKLNLEYDIPEDIYEQFQFVYDGLRLNMLSDGDDIQVNVTKKSYKLIKTTKQLIVDGKYLDSVINLSIIIVKLIDKRIWNKDIVIYNPYLKMGFGNWEKTLSKTDTGKQHKNTTNELRSRWEPKFKLLNNNVFLVLPIHRVKAIFNYKDIRVKIKNGKEIIFFDDKPDIREIIGGYQVSVQNVKINNPLGELQYTILTENEIIYDSKNKLHRDFIVFDENGDEIKNNTDYKGIVVVCAYEEELPYQKYFKTNLYCLGSNKVSYEDTFIIKNEIFSFSSLVKPGVFGEKIPRLFLKKINTNNLFPVFSKVNFLVFENSNNNEKYEIIINGRSYRLTDFKYAKSKRQVFWRYIVDLNISDPGIYSLFVYELFAGRKKCIAKFIFGYDPEFLLHEKKIDDYCFVIDIQSGLLDEPIVKEIDIHSFSDEWLTFDVDGELYTYLLPIKIALYRINNIQWRPMSENLWIEDVDSDTVLEITGLDVDELAIYSDKGEMLQSGICIKNNGIYWTVPIGFLVSFKTENDYIILILLKDGKKKDVIFCYNRCVFNKEITDIHFDPVEKTVYIYPYYYGKGNILFQINNENGSTIFKEYHLESGKQIEVKGIESFVNYQFLFYEINKGLLIQKNRELMNASLCFFAREDFVGRYFKIKEVQFDQMVRGKFLRKSHYFRRVYVHFIKKISDDIFEGDIIVKTANKKFGLFNINPVEIEICSDVINDEIELSITKDGDGLFLDFEHHGIMNTLHDNNATDIFSYLIDVNGEKLL